MPHQYTIQGRLETRALRYEGETLHLPQLFSSNMAVCGAPASRMHGMFPRFKGSPAFLFFHLLSAAHGQNHRLIFQNVFLACTRLYHHHCLTSSLYNSRPSVTPMIPSSLTSQTHTLHSLFTTYPTPHPRPACKLTIMYDIFPYLMFCCSSAPFNPIRSVVCFMD